MHWASAGQMAGPDQAVVQGDFGAMWDQPSLGDPILM